MPGGEGSGEGRRRFVNGDRNIYNQNASQRHWKRLDPVPSCSPCSGTILGGMRGWWAWCLDSLCVGGDDRTLCSPCAGTILGGMSGWWAWCLDSLCVGGDDRTLCPSCSPCAGTILGGMRGWWAWCLDSLCVEVMIESQL